MSDLESALTLRPTDDGDWLAHADPRYESTNGMFGGWVAAVLLRGVMMSADREVGPSAITVNYVDKVDPNTDVIIKTRGIGGSRSVHHWQAEMVTAHDQRTLAHATLVLSNRRDTDGFTQPSMPEAPDPDTLEEFHPPGTQGERTLMRPVFGHPPFGRDDTSSMAWVREMTGRQIDHLQLAFLSDAYAPRSFFWSDGPRLSATLTLSIQFHATDDEIAAIGDDNVLNEAIGTRGAASTSGQQARLWSRQGALLVTTEQLNWYR